MMLLMSFFLLSAPAAAGADEKKDSRPAALWSQSVKIDGRQLTIEAASRSGDAMEDDMSVTIHQDDEKIRVPVRQALYEIARVSSDQHNYAEELPVFRLGPGKLLIILTENARPGYPYTTLVVYDYIRRKVTDIKERVASFKQEGFYSRYAFVSFGPDRYRLRLIREHLNISDGPEDYIEAWMIIRYANGRLGYAWQ